MENVIQASGGQVQRGLGRSVGAVLAGFVTILVTHTGADALLHATGVFPPAGHVMSDALFVLAASYRFVFSVLGAYVTARLAATRPLKHALVLGGIGVALSCNGHPARLTGNSVNAAERATGTRRDEPPSEVRRGACV